MVPLLSLYFWAPLIVDGVLPAAVSTSSCVCSILGAKSSVVLPSTFDISVLNMTEFGLMAEILASKRPKFWHLKGRNSGI